MTGCGASAGWCPPDRERRRAAVAQPRAAAGARRRRPAGAALHRAAARPVVGDPARRRARASRQRPLRPERGGRGLPAGAGRSGRLACRPLALARARGAERHLDRHRDRQPAWRSPRLSRAADRRLDRALPRYPRAASRHRAAQRRRPLRHRAAAQDRSRPALSLGQAGARRHRPVASSRREACRGRRADGSASPGLSAGRRCDAGRCRRRLPASLPARAADGIADPETRALLADLLEQVGAQA